MILESLGNSEETRHFIESIVDNYVIAKQSMIDNSNPNIIDVGVGFDVSLTDMSKIKSPDSCSVFIQKVESNSIKIYYLIKKELHESLSREDSDDIDHFIKMRRTEVIDKITLIKWLKDAGYIFLIDDKTVDSFEREILTKKTEEKWERNGLTAIPETIQSKELYDIVSQSYNSRIIPSPQLIDLRNNNFKTPEQRRFEKNQCISKRSIQTAILIAIFTSLVGIITSLFIAKCSRTTIDESQYKTIINTIIDNNIKSNINEQVENAEYGCDQRECGKDSCVVSSVRH